MVTEAQKRATAKYNKKTYLVKTIKLRKNDHADVINYIEEKQKQGVNITKCIVEAIRKAISENK